MLHFITTKILNQLFNNKSSPETITNCFILGVCAVIIFVWVCSGDCACGSSSNFLGCTWGYMSQLVYPHCHYMEAPETAIVRNILDTWEQTHYFDISKHFVWKTLWRFEIAGFTIKYYVTKKKPKELNQSTLWHFNWSNFGTYNFNGDVALNMGLLTQLSLMMPWCVKSISH